ncbi:MAG: hypothetical protein Q4D91_15185 [Lautropia sp.]|nr:hypothetical protein [Lautropia sp.]
MEHPLLAKVQPWQDPSDTRPHAEWLNEQIAISEEIGGEYTIQEVVAYIRDELAKKAESQSRLHEGSPTQSVEHR